MKCWQGGGVARGGAGSVEEFYRRCRVAKVSGVSLHSFRYAWAERALQAGIPERFAMANLGYSSPAVHRYYSKRATMVCQALDPISSPKVRKSLENLVRFSTRQRTAPFRDRQSSTGLEENHERATTSELKGAELWLHLLRLRREDNRVPPPDDIVHLLTLIHLMDQV